MLEVGEIVSKRKETKRNEKETPNLVMHHAPVVHNKAAHGVKKRPTTQQNSLSLPGEHFIFGTLSSLVTFEFVTFSCETFDFIEN